MAGQGPGLGAGRPDLGESSQTPGHSLSPDSNEGADVWYKCDALGTFTRIPLLVKMTFEFSILSVTRVQQGGPALLGAAAGQDPGLRGGLVPGSATPSSGPCREPRKLARPRAGGAPTHQSSRRAQGARPPRTPRWGTVAGGRRLCPADAKGTREVNHEGLLVRGRCPNAPPAGSLPRAPLKLNPHFSPCGWRAWGHRAHHRPRSVVLGGSSRAGGWQQGESSCSQPTLASSQGLGVSPALESGERVSGSHPPSDVAPPNPNRGHLQTLPGSMINCRLWGQGRARNA